MSKKALKLPAPQKGSPRSVKIGNLTYAITTAPIRSRTSKKSSEILEDFNKAIKDGTFRSLEENHNAESKT